MSGKALILGYGISGSAAADLLISQGYNVAVFDHKLMSREDVNDLEERGASVFCGSPVVPKDDFDLCVVSPGFPTSSDVISDIISAGAEVISELELGYRNCKCPILGITGSKGKSTMVRLCADAFNLLGMRVEPAGNYGVALCDVARRSDELDWVVVEASSFQLELVKDFSPRVGVILNLQPDHLDRHGSMDEYCRIKTRLIANAGNKDKSSVGIILDRDSKRISGIMGRNDWIKFGISSSALYRYEDGRIVPGKAVEGRGGRRDFSVNLNGTLFDNKILGLTAAATVAALDVCGVDVSGVEKAASEFKPLPHRMNSVLTVKGVEFVDDSKATSLTALNAALEMSGKPVLLVAGGILKEDDLKIVKEMLSKKVKKVYLIGSAQKNMLEEWSEVVRCYPCGRLDEAVNMAWAGDAVLLSPGCASFDQFKDFADRGDQFVKIASLIREEESK